MNRRATMPSEEELQLNRRSRSAKLRCAEQILSHTDEKIIISPISIGLGESSTPVANTNADYKNWKSGGGGAKVLGAKQLAKLRRSSMITDDNDDDEDDDA